MEITFGMTLKKRKLILHMIVSILTLKLSRLLNNLYENYLGKPIEHSYKYNFKHWSLIKVDSVIDLETGDFVLK